jgi:transcription elongation factor S-II
MQTITNPDVFRKNIANKFNLLIDDEKIAANLEIGIYNYTIKESTNRKIIKKWENKIFAQVYLDRLRSIYLNIKNPDNTGLLTSLKNGEITPQTLSFMTHQEMHPDHWRVLIEQKIKRDANRFTNNIQPSTDMFTCKNSKCRSKRCTYYELQTRSADEPATIFITCLDCGKNWKS